MTSKEKKKPKSDFTTIALPTEMIKHIDMLRMNDNIRKRYYFNSRAQFIAFAISKLVKELEEGILSQPQED